VYKLPKTREMRERQQLNNEYRERMPTREFQVTVIGPAASGKSTLLNALEDQGYSIRKEPENPVFPLYLENPQKYAFENQLTKMTQLMQLEIMDTKSTGMTDPHFRESGVLATDIYNRYFHDNGLLTDDQYGYLHWLYQHHLVSFPTPDLVIFLHAPEDVIKNRAVRRDGTVAHDPRELAPYWDRLLEEIKARGIPLLTVDTGSRPVPETVDLVMKHVDKLKKEPRANRANTRPVGFPGATVDLRRLPTAA
jgi:deoxyadenosine/deoxycytidine kinase